VVRGELAQLAPELGFEPEVALNGGEDGLEAYRALAPVMARRVASEGLILLEIGAGQVEAVSGLLLAAELVVNHVAADLAGRPRVVVGGRNPKKVLETGR
jgi:release factor glutamine methyltransferase